MSTDRDAGQVRLTVRINDDCASHVNAMAEQGMTATEVVRQALALHKFVRDGGRLVTPEEDRGVVALTSEERLTILTADAIGQDAMFAAVERIIESRVDTALVEGANIGIYMRRDALAARQSDPDATERVEWGVRLTEVERGYVAGLVLRECAHEGRTGRDWCCSSCHGLRDNILGVRKENSR